MSRCHLSIRRKWEMFQIRCWFYDEFIIRDFLLWDIIDDQLFEILNDEFVYVNVFVIDNKLFKTTFKLWTFFVCRITIDETLFRFFAFFFDMIRWSTYKFITYEAYFWCTNRESITRTRVRWKSIIVTIVEEFTTILSIRETLIVTLIVKRIIDALKIRMLCRFIRCLLMDNTSAEWVNKEKRVQRWVMQFDDECRMISACSNKIFAKIVRIVISKIDVLL
jgi:hypothetical protein